MILNTKIDQLSTTALAALRVVDGKAKMIALDELREVAEAERPEDYFIGGAVDHNSRRVILYRGDFSRIEAPFEWFTATTLEPDFNDFEVIDFGQTLRFGLYEASSYSVKPLGTHYEPT